jgi:hypothetical protein
MCFGLCLLSTECVVSNTSLLSPIVVLNAFPDPPTSDADGKLPEKLVKCQFKAFEVVLPFDERQSQPIDSITFIPFKTCTPTFSKQS